MSEQTLMFDMTNWNVPQTVFLQYLATGCEQVAIKATGGGFDWQFEPTNNYIILQACHYDPATTYCKESPVCGN